MVNAQYEQVRRILEDEVPGISKAELDDREDQVRAAGVRRERGKPRSEPKSADSDDEIRTWCREAAGFSVASRARQSRAFIEFVTSPSRAKFIDWWTKVQPGETADEAMVRQIDLRRQWSTGETSYAEWHSDLADMVPTFGPAFGWSQLEGTVFLMTDGATLPLVPFLASELLVRPNTFRLEMEAWATEEQVLFAYRRLRERRQLVGDTSAWEGRSRRWHLGQATHFPKLRLVVLAVFVMRLRAAAGAAQTGPRLLENWNAWCQGHVEPFNAWRYENLKSFYRAVSQALESVDAPILDELRSFVPWRQPMPYLAREGRTPSPVLSELKSPVASLIYRGEPHFSLDLCLSLGFENEMSWKPEHHPDWESQRAKFNYIAKAQSGMALPRFGDHAEFRRWVEQENYDLDPRRLFAA